MLGQRCGTVIDWSAGADAGSSAQPVGEVEMQEDR